MQIGFKEYCFERQCYLSNIHKYLINRINNFKLRLHYSYE